jgi:hypothetical protein
MQPTIQIQVQSVKSLLIVARFGRTELSSATGFIVEAVGKSYLVTNWHVVTGRHPDSGEVLHKQGGVPDNIAIIHNSDKGLGTSETRFEVLYDKYGKPRWREHARSGSDIDVVALPLTELDSVKLYPYNITDEASSQIRVGVSEKVNIIGFPYGRTGGGVSAVWSTGHIASEPGIDYDNKQCFLIDSRTREGQSGSPVISFSTGGVHNMSNGNVAVMAGEVEVFLGVYSGRISIESDLGIVWKRKALLEILEAGSAGSVEAHSQKL